MEQKLFYDPNTLKQLTPRESNVLSAAKKKKSLDDIAYSFRIPQSLVIRHLTNIITKLYDSDRNLALELLHAYNLENKTYQSTV